MCKFQEPVYHKKRSHVCSAINSFQLHCRPDSLKAVNLDFSPENEKKQKQKQKQNKTKNAEYMD